MSDGDVTLEGGLVVLGRQVDRVADWGLWFRDLDPGGVDPAALEVNPGRVERDFLPLPFSCLGGPVSER